MTESSLEEYIVNQLYIYHFWSSVIQGIVTYSSAHTEQ